MSKGPVLILGARSDIGLAVAKKFASLGHPVQLAAREAQKLAPDRDDISTRYNVEVTLHEFDALHPDRFAGFLDSLPELPEVAACAIGYMGEQEDSESNLTAASLVMRSNYEGPVGILSELANRFEDRGSGVIIGISSVAGQRGRATNYFYGSAKAGFTAFLSGLRNRLTKKGVHVITVLPGFVATRMTENLDLPKKLTAQPAEVAEKIALAVKKSRNVIYVRSIWFLIMTIICNIPENIFKKMKL